MSDAAQTSQGAESGAVVDGIINLGDLAHGAYPALQIVKTWWANGQLYGIAEPREDAPAAPSQSVYGSSNITA